MKKLPDLEDRFNERLKELEFLIKFNGDNELMIIGAPKNNLAIRLAISGTGIAIVTICLIIGKASNTFNTAIVIGGSLLGLITTFAPFISFYSRKYFKILISKRQQQVSISKGIANPDRRVDFSNIDRIELHKRKNDLVIYDDDSDTHSCYCHLFLITEGRLIELISWDIDAENNTSVFTEDFARFISDFTGKELNIISEV